MTDAEIIINHIAENCESLQTMPKQMTYQQADKLVGKYGVQQVIHQLNKMENKFAAIKKYQSVYLTCSDWFDMDARNGYLNKPAEQPVRETRNEVDEFKRRYPVGSIIRAGTGQEYRVYDSHIESLADSSVAPLTIACKHQFTIVQ